MIDLDLAFPLRGERIPNCDAPAETGTLLDELLAATPHEYGMPVSDREVITEMDIQPFNKTTLAKMAACEAVGLSYWSDHPAPGCMWAVDDNREAHVVRWYRKANEAAIQRVGEPRQELWWDDRGNRRYRDKYPLHDAGERVGLAQ